MSGNSIAIRDCAQKEKFSSLVTGHLKSGEQVPKRSWKREYHGLKNRLLEDRVESHYNIPGRDGFPVTMFGSAGSVISLIETVY